MEVEDKTAYKRRIVELEGGFYVNISRINEDVTSVHFVLSKEITMEIDIPANFSLINKITGTVIKAYLDGYYVCCASNYELRHFDKVVLIIE